MVATTFPGSGEESQTCVSEISILGDLQELHRDTHRRFAEPHIGFRYRIDECDAFRSLSLLVIDSRFAAVESRSDVAAAPSLIRF